MTRHVTHFLGKAHTEPEVLKSLADDPTHWIILPAFRCRVTMICDQSPRWHFPTCSIFSQRHERGSTIVTSNLPFDEWTSVFGNQRLTGALLDRLTHHVHILELNGESYRLKQSKARRRREAQPTDVATAAADPETGEIISGS